jgi:hypothetical protein
MKNTPPLTPSPGKNIGWCHLRGKCEGRRGKKKNLKEKVVKSEDNVGN